MTQRVNILGVAVSAVNLESTADAVDALIRERKTSYICVAPVSTVVACQQDEAYRSIINGADIVTPDGMPVVWLARMQGHRDIRRTYGPDLMRHLCGQGQSKGWRHYFFGGTPVVCQRLEEYLKKEFPQIIVTGIYSPPFRGEAVMESPEVIRAINAAKPDIVWIGLGSPKQDFWMHKHRSLLEVPVLIGVGAAFDFLSGAKPQAPRWMQGCGLEWLFRLLCEPRRLWKRYLIGNSLFIYYLIRSLFKKNRT